MTDLLNYGEFDLRTRTLLETISPAIDILVPSNIERLLYFLTKNTNLINSLYEDLKNNKYFKVDDELKLALNYEFMADFCTQIEQRETIKNVYQKTGYLIDPHTAVAKRVAEKVLDGKNDLVLVASTAHYAKFPETVLEAIDEKSSDSLEDIINQLKQLKTKPLFHQEIEKILYKKHIHTTVLERDLNEIKNQLYEISKQI